MQKPNNKIKTAISIIAGVPAALVAVMEVDDLRFVWLRFAGLAIVAGILFWNFRKDVSNA